MEKSNSVSSLPESLEDNDERVDTEHPFNADNDMPPTLPTTNGFFIN